MRQGSFYILLALVSVSTISCDTLVDDSQTQSDENVGCYVMKEITTNTLLDINKDGISHINMLEEFHTIPGFYVPYNKAEVIKDPYDLTDEVSCYYINSHKYRFFRYKISFLNLSYNDEYVDTYDNTIL